MIYRRFIHIGLAALTLVAIAPTRRVTVQSLAAAQQPGQPSAGQTETRLPDGRTLIIGGEGFERNAWIRSSPNDAPRPTEGALQMARAWHATTVLADGTVLITGGRYRGGFVEVAELFDPSTGTFSAMAMPTAARRAGHTATLLTDGRILLVGGGDDPRSAAPTELWDLT